MREFNYLPLLLGIELVKRVVVTDCHKMENFVLEPTGILVRTINYSTDQSQQVLLFRLICRMFSQELMWCERLRASSW